MRSTSTTVGTTLPDSIRLILDCDMTARKPSLSPERPAALRNSLSASARCFRRREPPSGSSIPLTQRHSMRLRNLSPPEVLRQVRVLLPVDVDQGPVWAEVQMHDNAVIKHPEILRRKIELQISHV